MRTPAMKRPRAAKQRPLEPPAADPVEERLQEIIATGYPAEPPSAPLQRRIAALIARHRARSAENASSSNRGATRAQQPQPSPEPRYHRSEGLLSRESP